jgi:hypothetical protein
MIDYPDNPKRNFPDKGLHVFIQQNTEVPITVAVRSKAWNILVRSNTGIVGSNPTWGMDVCVRLFCVCAVLCVQVAALRRVDPPYKESYLLCKKN